MARKLVVEIVGDARSLERTLGRATRSTKGFERGILSGTAGVAGFRHSLGAMTAGFLGGVGVVSVLKDAEEASTNLHEQITKSDVVFGQSAKAVQAWSQTTVGSMGLAEDQALQTASSFGALLKPLGFSADVAAEQSERLTQLGADLASFYNTDVQDALDAISSGLVGQSRPLRRYGALLDATRVTQEALTESGKSSTKELTNQDKVLARLTLLFRDTNQAQGDFLRTSEGLANQERIFSANVRQLETAIGEALHPAVLEIVQSMNEWLSQEENVEAVSHGVREAVDLLSDGVHTLEGFLDRLNSVTGSTTETVKLFVAAWAAFKITALITNLTLARAAIAAGGTEAAIAGAKVTGFRAALLAPWPVIAVTIGVDILIHRNEVDAWLESHGLGRATRGIAPQIGDLLSPPTGTTGRYLPGFGPTPPQPTGLSYTTAVGEHVAQQAKTAAATYERAAATTRVATKSGLDFGDALNEHLSTMQHVTDRAADYARTHPGVDPKLVSQWFDAGIARALDRVRGIPTIQGQIAELDRIKGLVDKRAKATKDVTRRLRLEDQAFDISQQISGLRQQAASAASAAAASAASAADDRAAKAVQAFDESIRRMLDRLDRLPLEKQLAGLERIGGILEKQIAKTKDVARRQELRDQLWDLAGRKADVRGDIAQAFVDSFQSKLDKAQATKGFADDLAVLNAFDAGITKEIQRFGRLKVLLDARDTVAGARKETRAQARAARVETAEALVDSFSLELRRAERTSTLDDDLRVLRRQERAALALIELAGRTDENVGKLMDIRDDIAAKRRERRQRHQFELLGLTPEGEERGPGFRALLARFRRLKALIEGTTLDTPKVERQFAAMAKVFALGPKKVTDDTLDAIHRMQTDIGKGLDDSADVLDRHFHGVTARKLIRAMHLGGLPRWQREQIKDVFGTLGAGLTLPSHHSAAFALAGGRGVTINGNVNVHGVQSLAEFEQQLTKRHAGRQHRRRGAR
jgi:hypothetical protein